MAAVAQSVGYVKTHRKGVTIEEVIEGYHEWADEYDEDLSIYKGPLYVAQCLASRFPEGKRSSVRVLDVAAGTGKVGVQLAKLGFQNVDALEPAEGMLKLLRSTGVYRNIIQDALFGDNQTDIPQDAYDCITVSGGMGEGHLPVTSLDEMIRVVKPGGIVCIVMREAYLYCVQEYRDKLEPYMRKLEEEGKWKQILRSVEPEYSFDNDGVLYLFKVY